MGVPSLSLLRRCGAGPPHPPWGHWRNRQGCPWSSRQGDGAYPHPRTLGAERVGLSTRAPSGPWARQEGGAGVVTRETESGVRVIRRGRRAWSLPFHLWRLDLSLGWGWGARTVGKGQPAVPRGPKATSVSDAGGGGDLASLAMVQAHQWSPREVPGSPGALAWIVGLCGQKPLTSPVCLGCVGPSWAWAVPTGHNSVPLRAAG